MQKTPTITKLHLGFSFFTFIIACTSLGLVIYHNIDQKPQITIQNSSSHTSAKFAETTVSAVAQKVSPSVVSVLSETKSRNLWSTSSGKSAGTGFIVSADGIIITNKHVVKGSSKLQVVLDNGDLYSEVNLIGVDPLNDIAFLKIKNAKNLPVAKLGDSKTISLGQPVIAIGNALGQYQNTVTQGIISGTGRQVIASDSENQNTETLTDMIQTDASINPGNSGGPLVNAAGEIIGINTAVSNTAQGIGFAIPISAVKGMFASVSKTGKLERPYLGIYYTNITPAIAKQYNLPVKSGAYVYSPSQHSALIENGPAAKNGIKDKDIITAINDITIGQAGSMPTLLGEYTAGDTIKLRVIREKKELDIILTLEAFPNN